MRKSTLWYPAVESTARGSHGARPPVATPPLLTTAPVKPPSNPPGALPLIIGVTGCPDDSVTMVEKAHPLRIILQAALERPWKVGIQTRLPTKRWRWSKS